MLFLVACLPGYAKDVTLVLDASGSMWGQIEGEAKISIARDVIDDMLEVWQEGNELGLFAYGHRRKGDCSDIEQVLPVAPVAKASFSSAVRSINPKGKTPLSKAIRTAAEAMRYREQPATVILISDGEETCGLDPCQVASELFNTGLDFTTHVIGFDVNEEPGLSQLQCFADDTGGTFHTASSADELQAALEGAIESVSAAPDESRPMTLRVNVKLSESSTSTANADWVHVYRDIDSGRGENVDSTVAGRGTVGFKLEPGKYIIEAIAGAATAEQPVEILPGQPVETDIILNAGIIELTARATAQGQPIGIDWLRVYQAADPNNAILYTVAGNGVATFVVSAGDYIVEAVDSVVTARDSISVPAGETLTTSLVMGSGTVRSSAVMTAGGKPIGIDWFYVYETLPDGSEQQVTYALGGNGRAQFNLGAGEYILEARSRNSTVVARKDFTVAADNVSEVEVDLNAALINMSAVLDSQVTGVDWFYVFEANADGTQGRQISYTLGGSGRAQVLVPAGNIIVTVRPRGGMKSEAQSIKTRAGDSLDVTIPLKKETP